MANPSRPVEKPKHQALPTQPDTSPKKPSKRKHSRQKIETQAPTSFNEKVLLATTSLLDGFLAVIGSQVSKLIVSLLLLIVACGVQLGILWKLRFFKRHHVKGNLVISVIVVAVFSGLWRIARPEAQPTAREIATEVVKQAKPGSPDLPGSRVIINGFSLVRRPSDNFDLEPGKPISVNFTLLNIGSVTAQDVRPFRAAGFVKAAGYPLSDNYQAKDEQDREIEELFKPLFREIDTAMKRGYTGMEVIPNYPGIFFSATIKSASRADIKAFYANKKALCAVARVEYDGTQWTEVCVMLHHQMLDSARSTGQMYFQLCGSHNTSGTHRPGGLR